VRIRLKIFSPIVNIIVFPVFSFLKIAIEEEVPFDTITPIKDREREWFSCSFEVGISGKLKELEFKNRNEDKTIE